jgi:membrane protein YfhO
VNGTSRIGTSVNQRERAPDRIIRGVSAPLSLLFYAAIATGWAVLARWLARPLPRRFLLAFLVLPVLFLLPAFVTTRTIFPVDHARSFQPWNAGARSAPANPNLNDVSTEMGPWAKAVRMAWKEGSIPWRNRWNACGSPLAANGQSAAFSPLTLLLGVLPLVATFNVIVAVKLFTALAGTWLWLSELGVRPRAALFGAVVFAFSFTLVPWLLFPHTSVIALWPWALFAIERLRDPSVRDLATGALTLIAVLQILAGHPESVVLGILFTGVWLVARLATRNLEPAGPVFVRAGLAAALAVGISAFLLVPQLLAIRDSNRAVNALAFSKALPVRLAPHGPAWPFGVFTTLLPRSLGDAMGTPMLPIAGGSFPEMAMGHFGLVGLAAALLIFRRGSKRPRAELALLPPLVIGFATAVLLWPVFDLLYLLPGIQLMLPLRFFAWVGLAGSAVAAFEVDRLARDVENGRVRAGLALAVSAGVLVVAAGGFLARLRPFHEAAGAVSAQLRETAVAAAFVVSAALLCAVLSRSAARAALPVAPVLLAILAAGELFFQGRRLYRLGPRSDFYPPTPLVQFLERQEKPFRVIGEGPAIYPSTNVFAGVEDVRIHDPIERRDFVEWLDRACGYDPAAFFKHVSNLDCAGLDFANVKYLVAAPGRAAPGAKWRPVYSGADGTVFENGNVRPRISPFEPDAARISDYRETTNTVRFRSNAPVREAVLVASLVQDGGWKARDESGRVLPVTRANGPFLAVTVPRGDHRVSLTYAPPGARAGAALSLVSLVAAGTATLVARRKRP